MKAEYIDNMGTDLTVVNAARVSFHKESSWDESGSKVLNDKDQKLIKYLASHNHFTPFTHCVITMRETVPIFVARQRFKHTVGFSYNEVSRRYVDDDPVLFIPETWRRKAENKKQGSSEEEVQLYEHLAFEDGDWDDPWEDYRLDELLEEHNQRSIVLYKSLLRVDVAPEQARMVLPQSMYTSYYVTGSLSAWARAYNLRSDNHAQLEIQQLAKQWSDIIQPLYPVSWAALTKQV